MAVTMGQYDQGRATKPRELANGEYGNQIPTLQMTILVNISGVLARLSTNGILEVRIMWIISVCDNNDSTNQPVWNKEAWANVLASKK